MKKILSLLALLVATVATAWAGDVFTLTLNGSEVSSPAGFFTHDTNGKFSFNAKFTGAEYDGISFTKGLKMEGSTVIKFTTTVESNVTIVQSTWSENTIKFDDVELAVSDAVQGTGCRIYTITGVAVGDHTIKRGSGESGLFYVKVEYTGEDTTPSLSVTPKEILLNASPLARTRTSTFTLTGKNLTDGNYNLTLPAVDGLSVEPSSFTVANGEVNQQFTVTYTSETDVDKGTASIVASVDNLNAEVTVTYQSRAAAYDQTIVSEAKSWDWETLTETVELTEESVPSLKDEFVFRELEDQVNFGDFDAQSIVISKAQFPVRSKKFQNGTIKFKTNRPGVITVDFSDTGSSGEGVKRYLYVNGVQTEYFTQRNGSSDRKVSGEITVPAGEVSICGWDPTAEITDEEGNVTGTGKNVAIVVYKVTFTPTGDVVESATATFDFTSETIRENIGEAMTDTKGYIYNETFTADGVTLQITAGSAPSRVYVDNNRGQNLVTYKEYTTLTFRAPEGKAITKIEFTAAGNSNINNFTASSGTIDGMTWTGNADGVRFAQGGTSYLANAIVTLESTTAETAALAPIEYTEVANIAAFNALEAGTYAKVTLKDAEVTGKSADGYSTVFVQDATGGCWIQYTSLNDKLQEKTKVSGTIYTVKRTASGNPQIKEAEDTPKSELTAEAINDYTMVSGTIAEVNVAANLNKVVKITNATLEETSATAGKLTQGESTIDVNNGSETANQQLHKIADWAKDNVGANVTVVAILVAKSASANQLLPISIEGEITTGISNVNANSIEVSIFNLQGQRMNSVQKGLNIINGKKIMVK